MIRALLKLWVIGFIVFHLLIGGVRAEEMSPNPLSVSCYIYWTSMELRCAGTEDPVWIGDSHGVQTQEWFVDGRYVADGPRLSIILNESWWNPAYTEKVIIYRVTTPTRAVESHPFIATLDTRPLWGLVIAPVFIIAIIGARKVVRRGE